MLWCCVKNEQFKYAGKAVLMPFNYNSTLAGCSVCTLNSSYYHTYTASLLCKISPAVGEKVKNKKLNEDFFAYRLYDLILKPLTFELTSNPSDFELYFL